MDVLVTVPTSGINNKTPVSEPGPKDIIKHPSDLNLPVIEKSSLYVRKAYVDIYELLVKYGSVKASNLKHKFLLTRTSGVGTYQTG
ncbi:unnamed protein product [Rhizophagus irregularis]|nr:unnamed protein product [Rhizophagus irregularis]CAB4431925.1 unnamed protein product [Rhizophagus irregularis]